MEFVDQKLNLRVMGFCGCDDSVNPELLQILSIHYSWIEWGILFRPDLEGEPRYASSAWVQNLVTINKETGSLMRLAGHLCGARCQEVLEGDVSFIVSLYEKGFGRVQVNATAANNVQVDPSRAAYYAENLRKCMAAVPDVEWIFQCNAETEPLWRHLSTATPSPPPNMSVLFDASCGKGVPITLESLPTPPSEPAIPCGYAGGIGPSTIANVLTAVRTVARGQAIWVDMESSLRVNQSDKLSDTPRDNFSIDKCFACIQVGAQFGLPVSRFTLLSI